VKCSELDDQIKEKLYQRESYNLETNRLKGDIDNLRYKSEILEK